MTNKEERPVFSESSGLSKRNIAIKVVFGFALESGIDESCDDKVLWRKVGENSSDSFQWQLKPPQSAIDIFCTLRMRPGRLRGEMV